MDPLIIRRQRWNASAYQLDGKLPAAYKHSLLNAMLLSYSEAGATFWINIDETIDW